MHLHLIQMHLHLHLIELLRICIWFRCWALAFAFAFDSSLAFAFAFKCARPHLSTRLLLTQSSHLSLGIPRFLLPCSRNSAALFVSMSSAILSTCLAHSYRSLLLTSHSLKLLYTPVSSLNSTILLLSALVTLPKQPKQQGNPWAKAATPGFCGSLPSASDCIVSKNCTKWFTIITSFKETIIMHTTSTDTAAMSEQILAQLCCHVVR